MNLEKRRDRSLDAGIHSLKSEIQEFVRYYRAHARYLGLLVTVTIALVSIIGKVQDSSLGKAASGSSVFDNPLFWFGVAVALTTVVTYLAFDALEAQYGMFATASRAAVLEEMINARSGQELAHLGN
jgi:hypothetical protein